VVIGRAALRGGIALAELRTASDAASLEHLFFELTSDNHAEHHHETLELQEAAR
jgi:hypothetical protein